MTRFIPRNRLGVTWPPPEDVQGDKPWHILMRVARACVRHRTTGHAAEMAFFAVLTLVPSTVAVGSALGLSERFIGADAVNQAEDAAIRGVRAVMGPELTDAVIEPFVHAQLSQPQGGVAIGGLLIAWWLSSHLFAATGHALDFAYDVRDSRPTIVQRFIALGFALGSVLVVSVTVELIAHGPLGRNGGFFDRLGLTDVYNVAWSIIRWPVMLSIVVTFLMLLYRFSPNVRHSWRDCLPGAVIGALLWICAAVVFRVLAALGLRGSSGVAADDPAVKIIGQSVNAVVATVLWAYLASIAILIGGEFNAVLRERRARKSAPAAEPPAPAATAAGDGAPATAAEGTAASASDSAPAVPPRP
jgi:membrane protein